MLRIEPGSSHMLDTEVHPESNFYFPAHISSVYATDGWKGTRGVPDLVTADTQCKQTHKQSLRLATPLRELWILSGIL